MYGIMRPMLLATSLFGLIVWDLTINHGRVFRTAASILAHALRQIGLI
jgi:hypothetical protein